MFSEQIAPNGGCGKHKRHFVIDLRPLPALETRCHDSDEPDAIGSSVFIHFGVPI
jgi:hypothetical protein